MNRRVNYIILAVFTLLLTAGAVYFIYWLGKFNANKKPKNYYQAIFHESVSGLNIASPVKYMGVNIGSVKKITINPNEPNSVIVTFTVDKNIPLRKDSYAVLELEGITGLKYIEIEGGSKNSPILKTSKHHPATIKTIPSFNAKLFEALSSTTDKLNTLLDNLNTILDPKKASHLQNMLIHLEKISAYLDKNKYMLKDTIQNFNQLQNNLNKTITALRKDIHNLTTHTIKTEKAFTQNFNQLNSNVSSFVKNSNILISELTKKTKEGQFDLKDALLESFKPIDTTSNEIKKATIKLENLLNELQNSPSDIIFKKANPPKGPGE
ncbi:MlaD family protein [Caminibacter pacificus]|uniref:MCE family protein n=1 Tax=Caminibacter pacificus TaxID=1424653 RepID=A0AAJ4UX89_9BACT|nr:MlaD family protein [Caminibacter pacificus]NPA87240.1 MCE family protein [Campylobacterota bacterium]QCI29125.1 MCE family protein [Caminibacter pacificus]ROR39056.1 phospholipid/cholesterol/gamma-HCH transport system substrate-binding protein [Caminibacter pacificus]